MASVGQAESAHSGGSQSPLTADVDGAGHAIANLSKLSVHHDTDGLEVKGDAVNLPDGYVFALSPAGATALGANFPNGMFGIGLGELADLAPGHAPYMLFYKRPAGGWEIDILAPSATPGADDAYMAFNGGDGDQAATFGVFVKAEFGNPVQFDDAVRAQKDITLDAGFSVVVRSPNTHRWRLTVSDAGVVAATDLGV